MKRVIFVKKLQFCVDFVILTKKFNFLLREIHFAGPTAKCHQGVSDNSSEREASSLVNQRKGL